MFKYAALAAVASAPPLKPTQPSETGAFFDDAILLKKFTRADQNGNGDGEMSLSELRRDYILALNLLTTEIRAVQDIYVEVLDNCYDVNVVGGGPAITYEEILECLEDYRNGN